MKNYLWIGLAAVALLATGCEKEPQQRQTGNGNSDFVVSIKSAAATRALLGDSDAATIANYESNVVEFTAYLFDENGAFLQQKSTSTGAAQIVFPGFAVGDQIQVVAVANSQVAGVSLPTLTASDGIADVTDGLTVTLQSQMVTDFSDHTKGFLMSGQYGADTATGNITNPTNAIYTIVEGTNSVQVPVERVVAKIELGDVAFGDNVTVGDLFKFQITGAGVQKAISNAFITPGEITTIPSTSISYYGSFTGGSSSTILAGLNDVDEAGLLDLSGLLTSVVNDAIDLLPALVSAPLKLLGVQTIVNGLLNGTIGVTDALLSLLDVKLGALSINFSDLIESPDPFWYVLPNNGDVAGANATLLTLQAEYDGNDYFYPIAINAADGADGTDGTFVRRNTRYVINLTFNGLIGNEDPDDPHQGTNVIATVNAINWEGPVNQDATW